MKVNTGDWVRFYQAGKLVIGVVQYITPDEFDSTNNDVATDVGVINEGDIVEKRSTHGHAR